MARFAIKALAVMALVCLVFDNASGAAVGGDDDSGNDDGGGDRAEQAAHGLTTQSPSLMDRVSGVVNSVKQQATETLDSAGNAPTSVLNRLQSGGPGAGAAGARNTENRLLGANALDRFQETKGRTVAAAKRVMDETVHKLQATVDDIRRTVSGDDWADDVAGDKRISNALDSLFRAVGSEGKAMFEYASDALNETADRAKAAVDKAQSRRPPSPQ